MTTLIANLRERYISPTSLRAVYQIPKRLGDSSGVRARLMVERPLEQVPSGKPARPVMIIWGEPFFVERDGDAYYIVHDRWSLIGGGKSLSEAYKDFLHMASVLTPVYAHTPPDQLDEDGTQLTRFLLRSR